MCCLLSALLIPFTTTPANTNTCKTTWTPTACSPIITLVRVARAIHSSLTHLQNDFSYSFYLRGKSVKMIKNELKLDVGLAQDFYKYSQFVSDTTINEFGRKVMKQVRMQNSTFQNITLKARLGYRFSDRINLDGDIRQIIQGRNFGDLLYDAKLTLAGGQKAGKIYWALTSKAVRRGWLIPIG
jgi:hypothetical protein